MRATSLPEVMLKRRILIARELGNQNCRTGLLPSASMVLKFVCYVVEINEQILVFLFGCQVFRLRKHTMFANISNPHSCLQVATLLPIVLPPLFFIRFRYQRPSWVRVFLIVVGLEIIAISLIVHGLYYTWKLRQMDRYTTLFQKNLPWWHCPSAFLLLMRAGLWFVLSLTLTCVVWIVLEYRRSIATRKMHNKRSGSQEFHVNER